MHTKDYTDENLETLRQAFPPDQAGQFPVDKIAVNDQGKARFNVSVLNGRVMVAFDKPVSAIGFSVKAARSLIRQLTQCANDAAALARKK